MTGIPRFLPKQVSDFLLVYLIYIRPFRVWLAAQFDLPGRDALQTYLPVVYIGAVEMTFYQVPKAFSFFSSHILNPGLRV